MLRAVEFLGEITLLSWAALKEFFAGRQDWGLIVEQLSKGGVDSWSITILTAIFTGMVMAMQFAIGLEPFGASIYTSKLVSLGIVRELGPVLTALLVGGRVGAGFTAELGSMAVTEQIDAIRCLGADPVRKLVMPRVVAMTLIMPLLTVLADLIGCFGGGFISMIQVDLTAQYVMRQMLETIGPEDLMHGLMKSTFFGYWIAIIACWKGMNIRGGAESVGIATTETVVYISVGILVSDFVLTQLFLTIYG